MLLKIEQGVSVISVSGLIEDAYNGDMKNLPMRRSEREITDHSEILKIMSELDVCRVAMMDEGFPYIVPLNFGMSEEPILALYFHSAKEGRKLDLMRRNPRVAFEMDGDHQLISSEKACGYSFAYVSVMGTGRIEFIETHEAKKFAINRIMAKFTDRDDFTFEPDTLDKVIVYRLVIESISAKRHINQKEDGSD